MSTAEIDRMTAVLAKQRSAFTAAMPEPLSVRADRIDRAVALLVGEIYAAAAHFHLRLPELFCGFERQPGEHKAEYYARFFAASGVPIPPPDPTRGGVA